MFYAAETLGYEGDVRVGSFRGGGADLLVGTAGAGVALACLFGFGTGTVFCVA